MFNNPALNDCVIDLNASFLYEFLNVTIAQALPQVPENSLKIDTLREMPTVKAFLFAIEVPPRNENSIAKVIQNCVKMAILKI